MSKGNDEVMDCARANRTIAEFMGSDYVEYKTYRCPVCDFSEFKAYSESLDRLVPVWEKLKDRFFISVIVSKSSRICQFEDLLDEIDIIQIRKETIQEAACIATAKTIKELSNNQ